MSPVLEAEVACGWCGSRGAVQLDLCFRAMTLGQGRECIQGSLSGACSAGRGQRKAYPPVGSTGAGPPATVTLGSSGPVPLSVLCWSSGALHPFLGDTSLRRLFPFFGHVFLDSGVCLNGGFELLSKT